MARPASHFQALRGRAAPAGGRIAAGQRCHQGRRPVADIRQPQGKRSAAARRRRIVEARADAQRRRTEMHTLQFSGRPNGPGPCITAPLAMPAGRASMQDDAGEPGPQRVRNWPGRCPVNGSADARERRALPASTHGAFDVAIRRQPATPGRPPTTSNFDRSSSRRCQPAGLAVRVGRKSRSVSRTGGCESARPTLDAEGGNAPIVSGGYDISADQTDIRAALTSTAAGSAPGRSGDSDLCRRDRPDGPQSHRRCRGAIVMAGGAPRSIAKTRRLDSIERGEAPPPALPASISAARDGAASR